MKTSMKMLRWGVVLLAVAVMAAGCGVSKSKYLAATTSVEELTKKNEELQKSLADANAKSDQLTKDLATTQATVTQLQADLEVTKQKNVSMQSTYESLVGQLRNEVSSGTVQIQQMRDGINVNLSQDILFKSGSANLDKSGKELLTKVAEEFRNSTYEIVVIGHADNQKIGSNLAQRYPTNWELGSARASQIARLFTDSGVAAERLLAVSAGEARPRADNSTAEGRAQNRRIEIRLRPIEPAQTSAER